MNSMTTCAALRIFTNTLNLDFISTALGVDASRKNIKGDHKSKRNSKSEIFEQSVWIYESPMPDSLEIASHIDHILDILEKRHSEMNEIRTNIFKIDIFCMLSSEGDQCSAIMNSVLLERLSRQKVDLYIDLYPG